MMYQMERVERLLLYRGYYAAVCVALVEPEAVRERPLCGSERPLCGSERQIHGIDMPLPSSDRPHYAAVYVRERSDGWHPHLS